jgi:3-phenylpropionate/trans-cinnamate dioxygenase ferredoxin reductase component
MSGFSQSGSIVIVGAGQAAAQAVATLRAEHFEGSLTVIGDEPHAPYQRPPLSKSYLSGELDHERLFLRPDAFYPSMSCHLLLNCHATRIDRRSKRVILQDGRHIAYDKLLLATGGRARRIAVPGEELPGIHYLRSLADSRALSEALVEGRRLAIIGAGYIGLEIAAVAVKRGLDVVVIELTSRVMSRTASEPVSRFYQQVHEQAGVRFMLNASVERFEGAGGLEAIWAGGHRLETDLAVVGIGVAPNDSLAGEAGLDCAAGVRVDQQFRTLTDPAVFAAGDCARYTDLQGVERRLECVQSAIDQAKFAAYSMLEAPREFREVPWFWSDQYDLKLRIAGIAQPGDQLVLHGNPAARKFVVFHLREGRLIALESVNSPSEYVAGRKVIAAGGSLPSQWLAGSSYCSAA